MRFKVAISGFIAGTCLGLVAGVAEGVLFLEPTNLASTPGASIWFLVASAGVYGLTFGLLGGLVGSVLSALPSRAPWERVGRHGQRTAVTVGILVGAVLFWVGAWYVRYGPPDLAVFRLYCLGRTARAAGLGAVGGCAAYWIARIRLVRRLLASRAMIVPAVVSLAITGAAVLLAFLPWPSAVVGEGSPTERAPNVVLITIDTLRADHLEYLGYERPTSPTTRQLSERSVVFTEAVAHYPLTTPSHGSILSGRYVRSHGATGNCVPIHESVPLLSEILRDRGYTTAAFVTGVPVSARYGFARGFDHFVDRDRIDFTTACVADALGQLKLLRTWWRWTSRDRLSTAVARWIRRHPRTPFFLWIHQLAPHLPYTPPFRYERALDRERSSMVTGNRVIHAINSHDVEPTSSDVSHIVGLYDGEIAFTEHLLGKMLQDLATSRYLDDAVVVFTADHGEKLYDRSDYIGHGYTLYDEEIIVPLMFFSPSLLPSPARIPMCVETIDIAPTIIDLLRMPAQPTFQGVSLLPLMVPERKLNDDGRPRHPEHETPSFALDKNSKMVRFRGWKYIENENGREELYDLRADPAEIRNVVLEEPGRLEEFRRLLHAWDASVPIVRMEAPQLDPESIRALRSLGYIQ